MNKTLHVRALWDDEVSRWYSQSDVSGLAIETDTLDEFEEVLVDVASVVIFANHYSAEELVSTPLKELVPIVVWERPAEIAADGR